MQWITNGISGAQAVKGSSPEFKMFFIYPCRNGTLINFLGYTDSETTSRSTSKEAIIADFRHFHPQFLHILDLPAHSNFIQWKLRVLPLPAWIRGQAALLGDAAHATLPLLGQGAAMAVEEAGSLGCLLPARMRREDVPRAPRGV
ncbi:hypothetical protein DFH06DRAFT_1333359 [Mycena polygramma]|nr:hypothetical protein DFH06DRAFT_1333359 [Mycena polygramma]